MGLKASLATLDIVIIVVYLLVLIGIGFWEKGKNTTQDSLFLGGRNLTWPKIGFSIFSTNVSPNMLIGLFGIAYTTGMVASNFEWLAWPFLLLLGVVFVPHYLNTRVSTMPEFLFKRYGPRSYAFMSYFNLLTTLVVWLGVSMYAGGLIISQILHFPLWMAAAGIAVLATSYTVFGGLAAVVRTDLFQSALILVATMALAVLAFREVGGLQPMLEKTPGDYWTLFRPADDPGYPWHAILLGYPVGGIWYWCTDQTIVQRVLAAKDTREGQYGTLFTACLKVLIPFLFLMPGIMCFVLYPGLESPDQAYMKMATSLLPAGLVGLLVAAMLAALINTIAAGLNAFSTIFTLDIYKRRIQPEASPQVVARVGRAVIFCGAALAVCLAIAFQNAGKNLFDLSQGIGFFIAPPMAAVFFLGVMWQRVTPKAAEVILYGGTPICLILGAMHTMGYPRGFQWPPFLLMSFYLFAGLSILMITISLGSRVSETYRLPTLAQTYQQQGHKTPLRLWILWGLLAIFMVCLYVIFN
ncbi:MAG: sodium/solute symporter [Lewinellaceae bacterium]|nr:sodium/solute symporter [Lewinellaceae bacterium]